MDKLNAAQILEAYSTIDKTAMDQELFDLTYFLTAAIDHMSEVNPITLVTKYGERVELVVERLATKYKLSS